MKNYFYTIGSIWKPIDNLEEARRFIKFLITKDKNLNLLNKDKEGHYYIIRSDLRTGSKKVYPFRRGCKIVL